ncbi:MAG: acylase [SAR86 cluster bacterium]|uniref:Acylase n=1 Tax=SAR86 cluster bacterium TaxID=2030880 RepID=A0A2A5B6Z7_9GAMM|nr:MAG: acylase [SAR86 cluster bacterium]
MKYLTLFTISSLTLLVACSPSDQVSTALPPLENNSESIEVQVSGEELVQWQQQASQVSIIRDKWGIAHIYGKTDADTVFGTLYAQAEDDFNRVEVNYLNAMGRLAEAEGETELFRDLRMKLFIDPTELQSQYESSPDWLKQLMNAFASGLNYYLYTHPETQPKVITRFEPWMALAFTEGSIGGDIERVNLRSLQSFYGDGNLLAQAEAPSDGEPRGSNGFALAPSRTASGNALLWINPHTSFFFRSELHMVSEEGLNAYGAVTWGQFFVYQGFNENAGWMHTSSRADAIDEYLESVIQKDDGYYYLYDSQERKLQTTELTLPYKTESGMASKLFTVYHSHHGPVIREQDGKWVSIKLMQEPVKALTQSYTRTKAQNHEEFYASMELLTNSSNNTVYADSDGNIAYYHGNFIPRRDTQFDWNQPLDGSTSATEWQGLHPVDEIITLLNPGNGWIQNTNNWPFTAAAEFSPRAQDYPIYMANNSENPRGIHAVRVLENTSDFTIDSLIEAAYDPTLTAFEDLIPELLLITAVDNQGELAASIQSRTLEYIDLLREWDYKFSLDSVQTSLAVYWGQNLMNSVRADAASRGINIYEYMANNASIGQKLSSLREAAEELEADFGNWKVPWGEINRYQRLNGDIVQKFDDNAASIPVAFASSRWGSLASFGSRAYPGTKRMYGTSGNSFIAAVEFGERLTAKAITVGGLNNNPESPHFDDQAQMYANGEFRDVLFYREDIEANMEREYSPGN